MKRKMTGKEIYNYLEKKILDFNDDLLYYDFAEHFFQCDEEYLNDAIEKGYLSLDDDQGYEMFYCDL